MKNCTPSTVLFGWKRKTKEKSLFTFLESDKVIGKHEQQSFLTKIILKFTGIVILIISIRSET